MSAILKFFRRRNRQDDAVNRLDPEIRHELQDEAKASVTELQNLSKELHLARSALDETKQSEVFVSSRLDLYREKLTELSALLESSENGMDADVNDKLEIHSDADHDEEDHHHTLLRRKKSLDEAIQKVHTTHMDLLVNVIRLEQKVDDLERRKDAMERTVKESQEFKAILGGSQYEHTSSTTDIEAVSIGQDH